jgi:cardiolipin synthase
LKHLPNLLTAARIAMAPYIFYLMWIADYQATLPWFAAAAITDGLDGFLARRLNAASRIGAYLDPVADKILLSGSFLVLGLTGAIPAWLAVLVLGRDIVLLAGAGFALKGSTPADLSPSFWGKWSTVAQIVYVLLVITGNPAQPAEWTVAVLAVISCIHYGMRLFSGRG